jgi:hypothetical protein
MDTHLLFSMFPDFVVAMLDLLLGVVWVVAWVRHNRKRFYASGDWIFCGSGCFSQLSNLYQYRVPQYAWVTPTRSGFSMHSVFLHRAEFCASI